MGSLENQLARKAISREALDLADGNARKCAELRAMGLRLYDQETRADSDWYRVLNHTRVRMGWRARTL